ncbi:hypothetical protein QUA32_15900 [Microcoleus sp. Pol14D6]
MSRFSKVVAMPPFLFREKIWRITVNKPWRNSSAIALIPETEQLKKFQRQGLGAL